MSNNTKQKMIVVAVIVASAVIMRLAPHIPNFAPVTAAAIFGAAYLPKRYALFVPLLIAAVSDYLLLYINPFGTPVFNFSHLQPLSALVNPTTLWVWGSFMVSAVLGLILRSKQGLVRAGAVSVAASLQFFLVTNFGVWAAGAYARDLSGLAASYVAGLPFLQWTILGDLFYTVGFFGMYALAFGYLRGRERVPVASSIAV